MSTPDRDDLMLSVCVRDHQGRVVRDESSDVVLRTASVGKLLLLLECARQLDGGELDPATPLTRLADDLVADSGLWHLMRVDTLPLADVATLVAAVSDNLATNVLLRHIGLERVDSLRVALALEHTRLLDRVRSERDASTPSTLSTGTVAELSLLAYRIGTGTALGPDVDSQVARWLGANTDLSMVAGAFVEGFGVDPLAHGAVDLQATAATGGRPDFSPSGGKFGGDPPPDLDVPPTGGKFGGGPPAYVTAWNKTGTDDGVRADVGWVETGGRAYAYAVIAAWDPAVDRGGEAVRRMRGVGEWIVGQLTSATGHVSSV